MLRPGDQLQAPAQCAHPFGHQIQSDPAPRVLIDRRGSRKTWLEELAVKLALVHPRDFVFAAGTRTAERVSDPLLVDPTPVVAKHQFVTSF